MTSLPRDVALERHLTLTAARAAGLREDIAHTLSAFAESRAPLTPVMQRDMDTEAFEEFADARNYLVWGIQPIYAQVLAGDAGGSADYERRMRGLAKVAAAWDELHTPSR